MVLGGVVLAAIATSEGFGSGPAESALTAVDALSSASAAATAAAAGAAAAGVTSLQDAAAVAAADGSFGSTLAAAASSSSSSGPAGRLLAALAQFTPADLASMAYVSLLGGAASYGIFFYNASHGSLTALSSLTFLTPVFASAAGYVWLDEVLTPMQLAGAGVTLSAVALLNQKPMPRKPEVSGSGGSSSGSSSSSSMAQSAGQGRISDGINDKQQ